MTADELRALQRKCERDAQKARLSAQARNAGVLSAVEAGRSERWIAQALGVSASNVERIKRAARKRVA